MKKVLVIGGTGAMGAYLVPLLVEKGCNVDVVSIDKGFKDTENIKYICANAFDIDTMTEMMKNGYDGVVDFLIYPNAKSFEERYEIYLKNTKHYILLSSYRVYADTEGAITEETSRLLDVCNDEEFLASDDYSLVKARQEDIVKNSEYENYTIIRPAITYSHTKFQLVSCEADTVVQRTFEGKKVLLPKEVMDKQTTMTWAGDVAKMISLLLFNEKAYGETYTTATSEHITWEFVKKCYEKFIGLEAELTDWQTFVKVLAGGEAFEKNEMWKIKYDRLYNRRVDNSKILEVTGLKQEDLMPFEKGLEKELSKTPRNMKWDIHHATERMDEYFDDQK